MASKSELITKLILKGSADPSLQKAFNTANKLTDGSITKLKQYGQTAKRVAKTAAVALGAGVVAAAKSAIDYEDAFAGVMKTVDETSTTSYDKLSKGIIELSKRMPESANEIAGVAEAAGQLGIKADDILKFSETMVKLGTTTNLTSEEAATSIAKMFNITGTSMKDVDRFGATIVALGNNAATTESDIVNMASRIAAGGTQIGLTEPQILALSTTLSSVGLAAEGGGTAISTVMANIDKSVATNGKTLETWAELAGMSSSEFKKAWSSDAYGSLQKVIGGMGDATKGGENMNVILSELGLNGIRTSDTMKRLTNASKLMGEMTDLANKSWDENAALNKEAQTRYDTLKSKLLMAKNNVVAFGIAVGNKLTPYIGQMVDALNKVDFNALADKIGNAVKWISDHSTTIVAIIGTISGLVAGIKIAGFITTLMSVVSAVKGIIGAMGLLKFALALVGGPVSLVIIAVTALVGGFAALWLKCEGFRNFWIGLWNKIKTAASVVGNWLKTFFTVTIPTAIAATINWFKALPSRVATFLSELPYKIGYLLGLALGKVAKWGIDVVRTARTAVPKFIRTVVNFVKTLPSRIWTWLQNAASKVTAWGSSLAQRGMSAAKRLVTAVVNGVKNLPSKMLSIGKNLVKGLWNGVTNMGGWIKNKIKSFGKGVVDGVKDAFKINSPSKVMTVLGKFLPMGLGNGIVNNAKYAVNGIKTMGSKVMNAAGKIKPTIATKVATVGSKIRAFARGGTVTRPELAVVGDANETIVPHGNTPRNRSLLQEAARGVGLSAGGGTVYNFTFAPVINGGNVEENRKMLEEEEAEFERKMDEYFARKGRLAF